MKKIIGILSLIMIMVLISTVSCASSNTSTATRDMMDEGIVPPAPAAAPPMDIFSSYMGESAQSTKGTGWSESDGGVAVDIERKIIKTGYISLVVKDVEQSLDEISAITTELGGYIVSSNKNDGDEIVRGNVAIRVPAEKYDEAISKLRAIAVQVPNESTDTQDVTEEYIDLTARLSTLEATESQYLELLKKAETVEDILKVQQALSDVRQNIETLKGRIQYLDRTSDMSLININIREEATFQENGWEPVEILKSAVRGLATFGKVLVNILIWIAIFIPLWAVIGVVIWLIIRYRRKKKANQ